MRLTPVGGHVVRTSLLLVLAVALSGCYHPAYISPEPLQPGEVSSSLALTGYGYGPTEFKMVDVMSQVRVGMGAGLDVGVRLSLPAGLYADVKWNFVSRPFLMTADVGFTYDESAENDMSEHFISDTVSWYVYPTLLAGTRTLFGGARMTVSRHYGAEYAHTRPRWALTPAAVVGASFGDRFRFMPEAEMFWGTDVGFGVLLGIQLEFHNRNREPADSGRPN